MRDGAPRRGRLGGVERGQIVSGALLVEAVFRYPGLGGLLLRAILTKDYMLEQGIVLIVIVSIAAATQASGRSPWSRRQPR